MGFAESLGSGVLGQISEVTAAFSNMGLILSELKSVGLSAETSGIEREGSVDSGSWMVGLFTRISASIVEVFSGEDVRMGSFKGLTGSVFRGIGAPGEPLGSDSVGILDLTQISPEPFASTPVLFSEG